MAAACVPAERFCSGCCWKKQLNLTVGEGGGLPSERGFAHTELADDQLQRALLNTQRCPINRPKQIAEEGWVGLGVPRSPPKCSAYSS